MTSYRRAIFHLVAAMLTAGLRGTSLPARGLRMVLLAAIALTAGGCVRRSLTITTEPQGALVWLNDEEIGRSPATKDFLWYGDYDVVARLEGHQTLATHQRINAPWYQLPGIDFVTEVLYPGRIHDARTMHFELNPQITPDRQELLQHAEQFRERTHEPTKSEAESTTSQPATTQP